MQRRSAWLGLLLCAAQALAGAQPDGVIEGTVTLKGCGQPLHHADVLVPLLGRKVDVGAAGEFRIEGVPPGDWEIVAHMHSLSDARLRVTVKPGETARADFQLDFSPLRETVTVTASAKEETSLESFQSVAMVSQLDTAAKSGANSLGDLLDDQAGVAKRSFGPGTSRPVVRGFDGDRVLILEDGMRTGTLSSQSGDHGEAVDPTMVERIEVVRGPATLLYGSNAIGGVVNMISPLHDLAERPHAGLAGNLSATGGTNNAQGGGSANVRYGAGNWMLWAGGGGMRAGDYHTPLGVVPNSRTNQSDGRFGAGRFSEKASFSLGYQWMEGLYGVPFAGTFGEPHDHEGDDDRVSLDWRRQNVTLTGTLRDLGPRLEQLSLKLSYTDWNHRELEGGQVGTQFYNKQFLYRGDVRQRRQGKLSGTFGFWGMTRDFKSVGAESLSPPVNQTAIAAFALEELSFEKFRLQFGGRLENNQYAPRELLPARSFTGASASAGVNVPLGASTAFVANLSHSYRAPALEELYFNGPHVGNLIFEVGNFRLHREMSNGVDLALRHQSSRFRGELNFFRYHLSDFVFLAPTLEIVDGLREAVYTQGTANFTGAEAKSSVSLTPNVWFSTSFDFVEANLVAGRDTPLPRIPPVRGRLGLDLRHNGLSVRPELSLAYRQNRIFETETPTAGYAVPSVNASYSIARAHHLHVFSINLFNLTDQLYRNHLSFIKDLAPEMGRGVRFSYNLHFY